jgi:RNA polymerase sigma factor (sigma-70 family)
MVPADDDQLWNRAAAGEAVAFGLLFDRHVRTIYNFCFRRTADWGVAEDLTATVFLEAWRNRRRGETHAGSLLPWLYGIATNLVRNHRRRSRRRIAAFRRLPAERPGPGFAEDVAERLDDEREMRRLLALIEQLPKPELDVFVLCLWQELSYEEAAAALDLPVGTVRSRLFRARARLRDAADPAPSLSLESNGEAL